MPIIPGSITPISDKGMIVSGWAPDVAAPVRPGLRVVGVAH